MTTIILILLALYIAYLAVNYETTNPFTILKYGAKDVGIASGATPRLIKTARDTANVLAKESKLEMLESGEANRVSFKEGRKIGQKWAKDTFQEYNAELKIRHDEVSAKLAELCK